MTKRVLSGMRPTGKLHLGHWVGALSAWVDLQEKYQCFFMVADWHALMSEYKNPQAIKDNIVDNVSDWLSWGIDPQKAVIFVQSQVNEHLELFLLLSFLTPLGWLSRCPTFKEQQKQLKDKDINTYAFLGYPVLQAADILLYKTNFVPVGDDQLPHLELTREIVRRFHSIYKQKVFIEPQPILSKVSRLPGLDGRKMSKSYNNFIALDEEDEAIKKKVLAMITDPQRIRRQDKGHPEICNVYKYYGALFKEEQKEVYNWCTTAEKGCRECKSVLAEKLIGFIKEKREAKRKILQDKSYIYDILKNGVQKAEETAEEILRQVRKIIGV